MALPALPIGANLSFFQIKALNNSLSGSVVELQLIFQSQTPAPEPDDPTVMAVTGVWKDLRVDSRSDFYPFAGKMRAGRSAFWPAVMNLAGVAPDRMAGSNFDACVSDQGRLMVGDFQTSAQGGTLFGRFVVGCNI